MGEQIFKGPATSYEVPASGEQTIVTYTCTLQRHGGDPVIKRGSHHVGAAVITPAIDYTQFDDNNPRAFWLDATNTQGGKYQLGRDTLVYL